MNNFILSRDSEDWALLSSEDMISIRPLVDAYQAGAERREELFSLVASAIRIGTDREYGTHLWLEMPPTQLKRFTELERCELGESITRMNTVLAKGLAKYQPGHDTLELVDPVAAMNTLMPGMNCAPELPIMAMNLNMQWCPPGFYIKLTKQQVTSLIAAIAAGSALAWVIAELGLLLPAGLPAGLVAALLALAAAAIGLASAMSKNGEIYLKFSLFPPGVVPLPVL